MTNPTEEQLQENVQAASHASSQNVEQAYQEIAAYGGFSLLESAIKGMANMNPERNTRKKDISDGNRQGKRPSGFAENRPIVD